MTLTALPHARRWLASLQGGLIAAGVVLLVILAVIVQLVLNAEYHNEVDLVLRDSERAAQKLAFRTAEVFDRVDQSTLLVKFLSERKALPPLGDLNRAGILANDVARVVLVTNAKGFVANSTSDLIALNLGDEDDFKAHKRQPGLGLTIGVATPHPLVEGWVLPVSRRLNTAKGEFSGIVSAVIDPMALSAGYSKSEASDTVTGVVGLDGIYRSRLLDGKVSFGEKVDIATLERRSREIRQSHQPFTSSIDGVSRFVASVAVDGYPLIAVVAVNADSALAAYRHVRSNVLAWAAATAALILGGMLMLRSKVRELEQSRHRTRLAETVFRATLEGSLDAVSIMTALRDADGQLTDMTIVDSNARAAALIGRTREQLIGQRLCVLAPSMRTGGFLKVFDKVIAAGKSTSAEVQAAEPGLEGRWLHHQVVPVEDGIALITRDVTERRHAEQALAGLAHLDALTQLGNRRDFELRLREAQARARRNGQTLALLYLDLDNFKAINDGYGHAAGDELLVGVAARLRVCVRLTDTINRLGGDEFTVTLEGAGSEQDIHELCERIIQSLSQPYAIGLHQLTSTPSIGVALLGAGEALDSLQHRADAAMYGAKRSGKARYRMAPAWSVTDDGNAEPL